MPRPDRLAGAVAVGLTALAAAAALLGAARPEPVPVVDLAVLADLVSRVSRGESAAFVADYRVERDAPGPAFAAEVTVAHVPPLRVETDGSTLTARFTDGTVSCTQTDDGPQCLGSAAVPPDVPSAAVLAEAVRSGAYLLRAAGQTSAAGVPGACFRFVFRAGAPLPSLGHGATLCLARDGLLVRSSVAQIGATDERVLLRVDRDVTDHDLARLLAPFEESLTEGRRR